MLSLGLQRIIRLTELEIKRAVVMRMLCRDDSLVLRWVRYQQLVKYRWRPGAAVDVTRAKLDEWCRQFAGDPLVARAVQDENSDLRAEIHMFMVESVVADFVRDLTRRGLLVPSSSIVQKCLSLLTAVPQAARIISLRDMLASRDRRCKRWSHRFRDIWAFSWGTVPVQHQVEERWTRRRAGIFFRWMRYVLEVRAAGQGCIVVNMDETMLTSVKSFKVGVRQHTQAAGDMQPRPRERGLLRTSLMAAVASDDIVQAVLPQVRLPRARPGAGPSRAVVQAYSAARAPLLTLHGTGGWVTSAVMKWYMGRLARAVRSVRPDHRVVLVLDCCPAHLASETIKAAAVHNIDLMFIPARLTWLLQPLDTHVFAVLKRTMRQADFDTKVRLGKPALAPLERVELQGHAIRQVLVDRSWTNIMRRGGLTGELGAARPALVRALAGEQLEAAAPSAAELSDILQVPAARATEIRRSLMAPRQRAPVPAAPVAPPRADREVMSADTFVELAGASSGTAAGRRLVTLARLPSARLGRDRAVTSEAVQDDTERVQTRSMTLASRAHSSLTHET